MATASESVQEPPAPAAEAIRPEQVAMLCHGRETYGVGTVLRLYARGASEFAFVCVSEGPMYDWLRANAKRVILAPAMAHYHVRGSAGALLRLPRRLAQARRDAGRIHQRLAHEGISLLHTHRLPHQLIAMAMRPRGYRTVWQIHNNSNPKRAMGGARRINHAFARRGADLIMPVSDFIGANWIGCGVPVRTVRNAAVAMRQVPSPLPSGPIKCVIAGRLDHDKGHHLALEAVLAARREGLDVKLDIFGGPLEGNPYGDQLRRRARDAGDAVRFMGFRDDLRQRHHQYALGLQCRISPEPCSMWVCETLVDGLPLLASAAGGTPELVVDGVTGLLFESGRVDDLIGRLLEVAADRPRLAAMRIAAFQRGQEHFTLDRYIEETLAAYQQAVAR
jgi:glycosyltransferase involved in cell wall biosynthesis